MNIIIPMAGEGKRFKDEGYSTSKPSILTYDRRTGKRIPMVVCATKDLPGVEKGGSNVVYVDRDFHKADGTEEKIREYFSNARFITVDHLTDGQACTCLLAKDVIDLSDELLIAGCDNGMEMDTAFFDELRLQADALVFTYRHNEAVVRNPNAYGWMIVDDKNNVTDISIKKAISENPMEDHAVVATFWFKEGDIFVRAAEKMIAENDRINNEFYVDQVIRHALDLGIHVKVFEIDRYIAWGTPEDYELYQKTFEYWNGFYEREKGQSK